MKNQQNSTFLKCWKQRDRATADKVGSTRGRRGEVKGEATTEAVGTATGGAGVARPAAIAGASARQSSEPPLEIETKMRIKMPAVRIAQGEFKNIQIHSTNVNLLWL